MPFCNFENDEVTSSLINTPKPYKLTSNDLALIGNLQQYIKGNNSSLNRDNTLLDSINALDKMLNSEATNFYLFTFDASIDLEEIRAGLCVLTQYKPALIKKGDQYYVYGYSYLNKFSIPNHLSKNIPNSGWSFKTVNSDSSIIYPYIKNFPKSPHQLEEYRERMTNEGESPLHADLHFEQEPEYIKSKKLHFTFSPDTWPKNHLDQIKPHLEKLRIYIKMLKRYSEITITGMEGIAPLDRFDELSNKGTNKFIENIKSASPVENLRSFSEFIEHEMSGTVNKLISLNPSFEKLIGEIKKNLDQFLITNEKREEQIHNKDAAKSHHFHIAYYSDLLTIINDYLDHDPKRKTSAIHDLELEIFQLLCGIHNEGKHAKYNRPNEIGHTAQSIEKLHEKINSYINKIIDEELPFDANYSQSLGRPLRLTQQFYFASKYGTLNPNIVNINTITKKCLLSTRSEHDNHAKYHAHLALLSHLNRFINERSANENNELISRLKNTIIQIKTIPEKRFFRKYHASPNKDVILDEKYGDWLIQLFSTAIKPNKSIILSRSDEKLISELAYHLEFQINLPLNQSTENDDQAEELLPHTNTSYYSKLLNLQTAEQNELLGITLDNRADETPDNHSKYLLHRDLLLRLNNFLNNIGKKEEKDEEVKDDKDKKKQRDEAKKNSTLMALLKKKITSLQGISENDFLRIHPAFTKDETVLDEKYGDWLIQEFKTAVNQNQNSPLSIIEKELISNLADFLKLEIKLPLSQPTKKDSRPLVDHGISYYDILLDSHSTDNKDLGDTAPVITPGEEFDFHSMRSTLEKNTSQLKAFLINNLNFILRDYFARVHTAQSIQWRIPNLINNLAKLIEKIEEDRCLIPDELNYELKIIIAQINGFSDSHKDPNILTYNLGAHLVNPLQAIIDQVNIEITRPGSIATQKSIETITAIDISNNEENFKLLASQILKFYQFYINKPGLARQPYMAYLVQKIDYLCKRNSDGSITAKPFAYERLVEAVDDTIDRINEHLFFFETSRADDMLRELSQQHRGKKSIKPDSCFYLFSPNRFSREVKDNILNIETKDIYYKNNYRTLFIANALNLINSYCKNPITRKKWKKEALKLKTFILEDMEKKSHVAILAEAKKIIGEIREKNGTSCSSLGIGGSSFAETLAHMCAQYGGGDIMPLNKSFIMTGLLITNAEQAKTVISDTRKKCGSVSRLLIGSILNLLNYYCGNDAGHICTDMSSNTNKKWEQKALEFKSFILAGMSDDKTSNKSRVEILNKAKEIIGDIRKQNGTTWSFLGAGSQLSETLAYLCTCYGGDDIMPLNESIVMKQFLITDAEGAEEVIHNTLHPPEPRQNSTTSPSLSSQ